MKPTTIDRSSIIDHHTRGNEMSDAERKKKKAVIHVKMRDGTTRIFPSAADIERGYGDWYRLVYEPGFVVLDQVGISRLSIASADIAEILHEAGDSGFT